MSPPGTGDTGCSGRRLGGRGIQFTGGGGGGERAGQSREGGGTALRPKLQVCSLAPGCLCRPPPAQSSLAAAFESCLETLGGCASAQGVAGAPERRGHTSRGVGPRTWTPGAARGKLCAALRAAPRLPAPQPPCSGCSEAGECGRRGARLARHPGGARRDHTRAGGVRAHMH